MSLAATEARIKIVRRKPVVETPIGSLHPVLDRIYRQRNVADASELEYSLAHLHRPDSLSGIDEAASIIVNAIEANARIMIAGDYDADGATASALGYLLLKAFGSRQVAYIAPDRFKFGYGLTPQLVEFFASAQPDLIITVDNGISSIEGVRKANEYGISVIITDHHLPGDELPEADAIINPRLPGDRFGSKNLAGVGVIFYLLSVVRRQLTELNWFEQYGIQCPRMADYLDLVALGTVADMVKLDYNNRILVSEGLKRINDGRCRLGIKMLLESSNRKIGKITENDLGIIAGPKLNAAGRLEDILVGIRCLASNDRNETADAAEQLNQLNEDRKVRQEKMVNEATRMVADTIDKLSEEVFGHCLYRDDWHQGIVGLVASRIKDLTGKPTIAFAPTGEGKIQGSCRSIDGLNIRDLLADINTANPDLIVTFGGHAMAAGLTLRSNTLERFKQCYFQELERIFESGPIDAVIMSDGELDTIDLELAEAIKNGGPWGQGFPKPVFDGVFKVDSYWCLKSRHLKMELVNETSSRKHSAIYFGYYDKHNREPSSSKNYRVVYAVEVNEYYGKKSTQMNVSSMAVV